MSLLPVELFLVGLNQYPTTLTIYGRVGSALVALAGPVSNNLATVFGLGVRFSSIFSISSVEVLGLMQTIVLMNIVLAILI